MMPFESPQSRRQRVENAVIQLLDTDEYGNSCRYFQAGDIADSDSELTSKMAGSYLPKLADESPLESGIAIGRHTERNNSTVWVVKRGGGGGSE
ncbi:hypothetical protein C451_00340 [Halococcus thailandensis JCM 13552]|uniref:Uncharacterized protein n=1 Tax=Halococcus thailandensis JCM 13552 TaxID=1227457 RepID=M0NGW4_9EURY|nr:hypothetical protein C451_00340 [Halococcus thailandensis JCM 13552]